MISSLGRGNIYWKYSCLQHLPSWYLLTGQYLATFALTTPSQNHSICNITLCESDLFTIVIASYLIILQPMFLYSLESWDHEDYFRLLQSSKRFRKSEVMTIWKVAPDFGTFPQATSYNCHNFICDDFMTHVSVLIRKLRSWGLF